MCDYINHATAMVCIHGHCIPEHMADLLAGCVEGEEDLDFASEGLCPRCNTGEYLVSAEYAAHDSVLLGETDDGWSAWEAAVSVALVENAEAAEEALVKLGSVTALRRPGVGNPEVKVYRYSRDHQLEWVRHGVGAGVYEKRASSAGGLVSVGLDGRGVYVCRLLDGSRQLVAEIDLVAAGNMWEACRIAESEVSRREQAE